MDFFFLFFTGLQCDIRKVIILHRLCFCSCESLKPDWTVPLQKATGCNIYDMLFAHTEGPIIFHTATCSHFHASATVILTQRRPVKHFPLVAWAFKLGLKSERQDILHVKDMGVFTSTAVQTSLSCMNPLCFFQVSHLQYSPISPQRSLRAIILLGGMWMWRVVKLIPSSLCSTSPRKINIPDMTSLFLVMVPVGCRREAASRRCQRHLDSSCFRDLGFGWNILFI